MTCAEFTEKLDAFLAGDATISDLVSRTVRRHVEGCPACWQAWNCIASLLDEFHDGHDDRRVELAVGEAREKLRTGLGRPGRTAIRFDSLRTPIGRVFVGMSDQGVCDVTLSDLGEDGYRDQLAQRAQEVRRDPIGLVVPLTELDAYFRGQLVKFTVPVDLRGVTVFTRRVLSATRQIPFGTLVTYGEVARRIGSPGASRAVGGALGRNPVPIIVPCHRVVAHGGKLGGFMGGLDTKRTLLKLEEHASEAGC